MELTNKHNGKEERSKEILYYKNNNSSCSVHIFSNFIGISNLFTEKDHRNKGEAQALIKEVKKLYPNTKIKSIAENPISNHIFKKMGVEI